MTIIDKTLVIDGYSLTMDDIAAFIENEQIKVTIGSKAKERITRTRRLLEEQIVPKDKLIYGLHTGLGRLKDYRIPQGDQVLFQQNILYSHASGVGGFFDDRIVRLTMLLRANVFCRGNSGVRLVLVQRLVDFLNAGVTPKIPQIGSLGVGDLQPMAHLGLSLAGLPEGQASVGDFTGSSPDALAVAGVSPIQFQFAHREALALMSGSTTVLAAAILAWSQAGRLVNLADGALALSMEAFRGEIDALDARIHTARNINGQEQTADRVRQLLSGSNMVGGRARLLFEGELPRVQDPVSFRSSPQIHGAIRDALRYVESILVREINASTDNPLFFENDKGELESLSNGNFHGALMSYGLDLLAIVLTDLGVLSERRSARLLDPSMSYGLPANLVVDAIGLNTGFALIQANATALVGEMRVLATPASIGSIPAKNNQEDHNSMGMGAVRKALQIVDHLEMVLSIEYLCASQGIDIVQKRIPEATLGLGTNQIQDRIREEIATVTTDVYAGRMITEMVKLLRDERLTALVVNPPESHANNAPDLSLIS